MSDTIIDKNDVEKEYLALLKNPIFDKLSIETKKPNIFRALGVSDYEIRHSNFLAWLLDPHENHGLGDIILKKFLQDILINEKAQDISIISIANLDISKVEVKREWKNIDLLVITETFVVCIENKMWSTESNGQLTKYAEKVRTEFPEHEFNYCFVFLTPFGQESSLPEVFIDYSYSEIIEILEGVLITRANSVNPSIKIYLEDYIKLIKQNIMSDDVTNRLAKQLYLNHKDLFDFVFENKPDLWDGFVTNLQEKIVKKGWVIGSKNKGYVRFYTPKIEEVILIYNQPNGWPNKEAFLFELDFRNGNKIIFRTTVSDPKTNCSKYDKYLVNILSELNGAKENLGAKWKCHFSDTIHLDLDKITDEWSDKTNEEIENFLDEIEKVVSKVENQLLKYEEDLKVLIREYKNE
ncbi:PD-(D/E)XK nuclease family protein [Salegentibacter mishustinae]|uniref:PDDEXK-like family protein n=1 Tax=Salegentibacter mishustinae TaxID=270918 RepID=UPI001CE176AD|nr:PD-(D/E)XK nuclease family protein [Salegentibacter mishustinae]UBZ07249.1 PD-(D/E)XK nuclease family protein [Salegentibacter mishustinae]